MQRGLVCSREEQGREAAPQGQRSPGRWEPAQGKVVGEAEAGYDVPVIVCRGMACEATSGVMTGIERTRTKARVSVACTMVACENGDSPCPACPLYQSGRGQACRACRGARDRQSGSMGGRHGTCPRHVPSPNLDCPGHPIPSGPGQTVCHRIVLAEMGTCVGKAAESEESEAEKEAPC